MKLRKKGSPAWLWKWSGEGKRAGKERKLKQLRKPNLEREE